MADNGDLVYGPAQPGTTNATLYTVPGSTQAHVQSVIVVNTTGSAATLTLALNGTSDTAANHWLFSAYSVPANGFVHVTGLVASLDAADTITGKQGTSSALTVTINAVLET